MKQTSSKNSSCEFSTFPVIQDEINSQVKYQMDDIKRYLEITPEEEQKLINFYREQESLKYSNIDLDTYNQKLNQQSGPESILGNERNQQLEKTRDKEYREQSLKQDKKMANYYAEVLGLEEQKKDLLLTLLSSDDKYQEAEISDMAHQMNLNEAQKSELNTLYQKYMNNFDLITAKAKENGLNPDDENFDINKYQNFLIKEELKGSLDASQLGAMEKYFDDMK